MLRQFPRKLNCLFLIVFFKHLTWNKNLIFFVSGYWKSKTSRNQVKKKIRDGTESKNCYKNQNFVKIDAFVSIPFTFFIFEIFMNTSDWRKFRSYWRERFCINWVLKSKKWLIVRKLNRANFLTKTFDIQIDLYSIYLIVLNLARNDQSV